MLQACGFNALPMQKKPAAEMVRDALTGQTRLQIKKKWHSANVSG